MAKETSNTLIYGLLAAGAAWYFRDKIAAAIHPATPAGWNEQPSSTPPPPSPTVASYDVTPPAAPATQAAKNQSVVDCLSAAGYPGPKWVNTAATTQLFAQCGATVQPQTPPPAQPTAQAPGATADTINACLTAAGFPGAGWTDAAQVTALYQRCGAATGIRGIGPRVPLRWVRR